MGRHRQLSVALDEASREELEALAAANGRSIADEIRRRLELTLYLDKFEPQTRELALDIMELANELRLHQGGYPWWDHPKAHEGFVEAVTTWLDGLKPVQDPGGVGIHADPRTVGQIVARARRLRKQAETPQDFRTTTGALQDVQINRIHPHLRLPAGPERGGAGQHRGVRGRRGRTKP